MQKYIREIQEECCPWRTSNPCVIVKFCTGRNTHYLFITHDILRGNIKVMCVICRTTEDELERRQGYSWG
jgi:hypothetical protein